MPDQPAATIEVAAGAILDAVLPKGLPVGIVLLGLVYGAIYALLAVGVVLIATDCTEVYVLAGGLNVGVAATGRLMV